MVASTCNEATSTVALVDDHELVRRGIKQILARDKCVKVVGEASDAPHAISMIKLLQPDVLLLDIHLREGSGLDVARACRTIAPKTKVLIISAYDDQQYVRPLVRLGVRGYLSKSTSGEDLRRAIHDLVAGALVFPNYVADRVLAAFKEDDSPEARKAANARLTGRESEVLDRISEGLTNREIGTVLGISAGAAKSTLSLARAKLRERLQSELAI